MCADAASAGHVTLSISLTHQFAQRRIVRRMNLVKNGISSDAKTRGPKLAPRPCLDPRIPGEDVHMGRPRTNARNGDASIIMVCKSL
jgi:hypothetical protein